MGGQNIWVSGAAHPITEAAMIKKKTIVDAPEGFAIPKTAKRIDHHQISRQTKRLLL